MSEGDAILASTGPMTVPRMARELAALGVEAGMTLICHTSLSSIGWVNAGAMTVILGLEAAVGKHGTVVMPTQSSNLSHPALWSNPPVPESWWEEICATMPAFDSELTPSWGMGTVPEVFRKQHGARRSLHPHHSFAARGRQARRVCAHHSLDQSLGNDSPLGRLYDLDAWILMMGCGWESCTSLHLAEHRCDWSWKALQTEHAPLMRRARGLPGLFGVRRRVWTSIMNYNISTEDFNKLGEDFEAWCLQRPDRPFRRQKIGCADSRLVRMRTLVDFAGQWFPAHRQDR